MPLHDDHILALDLFAIGNRDFALKTVPFGRTCPTDLPYPYPHPRSILKVRPSPLSAPATVCAILQQPHSKLLMSSICSPISQHRFDIQRVLARPDIDIARTGDGTRSRTAVSRSHDAIRLVTGRRIGSKLILLKLSVPLDSLLPFFNTKTR